MNWGEALVHAPPLYLFAQHTQVTADGVDGGDEVEFLIEQGTYVDGCPQHSKPFPFRHGQSPLGDCRPDGG